MMDFADFLFVMFVASIALNIALIYTINRTNRDRRKDTAHLNARLAASRDLWKQYYRHNRKLNAKIKRIVLEQRRIKFAAVPYQDAMSAQDALDQIKREPHAEI